MALHIIGIGLWDEKDITVKGLELVRSATVVYLESYTSLLSVPISTLEAFYQKKVIPADRFFVENHGDEIVEQARASDVAFLVIGDPFGATTHMDLVLRARQQAVKVNIINNASILTAIGIVGLSLYKFGRTVSIPFSDAQPPDTPYLALAENRKAGLHTLLLLDIQADKKRFMTVSEAAQYLLAAEARLGHGVATDKTMVVACARIGGDAAIRYIPLGKVPSFDLGGPLHCMIVPGDLHFLEEDALKGWV
ncbi:MAG: diphthine synthase [Nanoarchaeota archaeon]